MVKSCRHEIDTTLDECLAFGEGDFFDRVSTQLAFRRRAINSGQSISTFRIELEHRTHHA